MSELDLDVNVDRPEQNQRKEVAAGTLLREARESKGLAIQALAASLKVSVKKIEALEAGRFDLLPDMVFARALAFSICRNLKIESLPILDQFPPTNVHTLKSDEAGINTPFHASHAAYRFKVLQFLTRPVVIVSAVLSLMAVMLYTVPLIFPGQLLDPTPVTDSTSNSPEQRVDPPSVQSELPVAQTSAPMNTIGSAPPTGNAIAVASGASAVAGNIVFKSRGVSWVEVVDAKGTVHLRRSLLSGEVVSVSGVLPLMVVVGKADMLEVTVAGKPFNLMGVAKDNIARFEVN
jgi:cytoskeleton protein RodZ